MADIKISQMPTVSTLDGTEKIPLAKDAANRAVSPDVISAYTETYLSNNYIKLVSEATQDDVTHAVASSVAFTLNREKVHKYNTYADLLASGANIVDKARADTSGYYIVGDGGASSYVYAASSLATHNAGTIVQPTAVSGAGRWLAVDTSYITPEDFGAIGDGIADDRNAIYNALNYACSTGTRFMGGAGKTYKIDSSIVIDRSNLPAVIIDWNGAGVVCNGAGISFTGQAAYLTTSLSANPVRGDAKVALASVTGIQQGDLIEINNPALTQGSVNALHYYLVSEVDGNDVYIEGNVVADINPQQISDSGASGSIVVTVYHLNKKFTMMNGHVTAIDPSGVLTAILISKNYLTVVDNMEFNGHCRNQLYILYNGHDIVSRVRVRDFGYINKDIGYTSLPAGSNTVGNPIINSPTTGDSGLSYGYGVIHARNYSSVVRDVVAGHGWHATDASRGQMHIIYDTVLSSRNGFGCSTHEGSWHVTWRNCVLRGKHGISAGRCSFPTIENCSFIDTRTHGVTYGNQCVEVTIRNCKFDIQNQDDVTTSAVYLDSVASDPKAGAMSIGYKRTYVFENNIVLGRTRTSNGFTPISNFDNVIIIRGNYFSNCSISLQAAASLITISSNNIAGVMGQIAIVISNLKTTSSLYITDNHEFGTYTTELDSAFIQLSSSCLSPTVCVVRNNTTTSHLLRIDAANVTLNEVSNNSARKRILLGNNTQTVKNKVNNIQGIVDYQVAVTTSANNTVMTL